MQHGSDNGPRLVVVSKGDLEGLVVPVRAGVQVIGRGEKADAKVVHPALSRQHAFLQWDGETATIADAGSTNGTTVNGERLASEQRRALRADDRVLLGSLELRFESGHRDETGEVPAVRLDNRIAGDNYGDVVQAGRDLNFSEWQVNNRFSAGDDFDELFSGTGVGRVLMVVGSIIALCGFCGWMAIILSGFSTNSGAGPFGAHVLGLPAPALAFGAIIFGGVLATVGRGMSRAARRREEDARQTVYTRPAGRGRANG
jgi:hypothetical protein